MMNIQTLVVDDEPLALQRIHTLLKADKDFFVQGLCESSKEALQIIAREKTDLLLLDIEMPEVSGMEIIKLLEGTNKPIVVFITAYDDFAIQAFEYFALDYILKPFSNERFQKMLRRVKQHISDSTNKQVNWEDVYHSIKEKGLPGKIPVKTGKKYHLVDVSKIAHVFTQGNYCNIILDTGEKFVHRDTIMHLNSLLPHDQFIRVHVSHIVAIRCVKQLKRISFGDLAITMNDDTIIKVSRKYKQTVRQLFLARS